MKIRIFSLFDYLILSASIFLMIIGIFFIFSSGINSENILVSNEYIKQIIWAVTGLFIMFFAALIDYRKIKRWLKWIFPGLLAVLLFTRFFGRYVNGARSWLGIGSLGIQPSEFGKTVFILFLAMYLEKTEKISERKRFITALLILILPVGLILLQPDLGTASVYIPIFLLMCFVAGVPMRYLLLVFLSGMLTIVMTVLPVWESQIVKQDIPWVTLFTNFKLRMIVVFACSMVTLAGIIGNLLLKRRYFFWIAFVFGIVTFSLLASVAAGWVLKDYQIKRLIVFLDPQTDPLGSGWNIIQSKIAIGSGSIFGQGFLKGTQSHYRFLPQQSTDFIFSILSEELGFAGGLLVFFLYFVIIFRTFFIMKSANNSFGYYIATGIMSMLFFHFVVNVGMVMGIMPITGIPLLFLSYGGSSLWNVMFCMGLLMSINFRRLDFN
ncbi:MAG TPA: rod shape-determining protein RodA [Treponemataceae bacterium]|nr:rod shape-determining protein RodA [Treponemataceae bacterium]HQL03954.1 rod shape-determining protein RodA [Treponemataceae bacterium]